MLLRFLLLFAGLSLWPQPPPPPPGPGAFQQVSLAHLEDFRRELTLRLLGELRDPDFRQLLASRLGPEVNRLSLNRLVEDYARLWPTPAHRAFAHHLQNLDLDVRQKKGLQAFSRGLLGLEVIWPKEGPRHLDWETVLFGIGPQGPKRAVTRLEAYDARSRLQFLDPHAQPAVLVLMAGTDRGETKRAAIAFLNAGLRQAAGTAGMAGAAGAAGTAGMAGAAGAAGTAGTAATGATGMAATALATGAAPAPCPSTQAIPCSKLTYIRLADDQEPWWKGAAEVYAFTAGIDPAADKPAIKLIDLPYLNDDHTDYFPNQLVLFWSDFRFNAADFQLWEQDDGTNYQDILAAVLSAVTTAMTLGGVPVYAWIPALAEAIIKAMPSSWFTDTDDYLDTFYTLEKGRTYERLPGAGNNAVISLAPFLLQPQP